MVLANQEAQRVNHEYIGTEHILLGLIKEDGGVAANVLKSLDLDLSQIRQEVEKLVQRGRESAAEGNRPQTPRAKKVIEYSLEEAGKLKHNYVGTEHILLGVLREREGIASQVLSNLGLILDEVRAEVLNLLGHEPDGSPMVQSLHGTSDKLPPGGGAAAMIAVDIGNSRMKLGRFARAAADDEARTEKLQTGGALPEPDATFDLAISQESGEFHVRRFSQWCDKRVTDGATWVVASVHRAAGQRLTNAVADWAKRSGFDCPIRHVTYRDVPLAIRVDEPARVGIDRLLAALAADRLRQRDRAAVIVDLGTAITVDLLEVDGAFAGGAILPGIAMSAQALSDHTDALPQVALDRLENPPPAPGKSTTTAIEAGLYWGAVGAIRELVRRMSPGPLELFLTGGASSHFAELLATNPDFPVHHVPHLVLSGIALVADSSR